MQNSCFFQNSKPSYVIAVFLIGMQEVNDKSLNPFPFPLSFIPTILFFHISHFSFLLSIIRYHDYLKHKELPPDTTTSNEVCA